MSVEQKVKQIIVEQLGVGESQVDNNASFVDDQGADSLDIVELVMAFEEAFELEIPDEDAEKITTVKDAVSYIEGKTGKKKPGLATRKGAAYFAKSCGHGDWSPHLRGQRYRGELAIASGWKVRDFRH